MTTLDLDGDGRWITTARGSGSAEVKLFDLTGSEVLAFEPTFWAGYRGG